MGDVLKSGETIIAYLLLPRESDSRPTAEIRHRGPSERANIVPQEFFDRVLPNWIDMQRHLGQIALARASLPSAGKLNCLEQNNWKTIDSIKN